MLLYILKSATCLAILLAFYKIFLERENMHTFKRFYLLGSLLAAFAIPFITFVEYVEIPDVTNIIKQSNSNVSVVSSDGPEQSPTDYLPTVLWSIYFIGIVVLGFNFIKNLHQIIQRIQKNPKYKINRITNVLLLDHIIPHTFFNYIFLNKKKFEAKEIPSEVLLHEETHAKQKHSLDILLVELLQILFWFNPLIYFTKKAIKLNHEFLADKAVINKGVQPTLYQQILLEFSSNSLQPQLANSINYSSIKKRFTVMKTKTSQKSIVLRTLFLLPLLVIILYGFSEKKIIERHAKVETSITSLEQLLIAENINLRITKKGEILDQNSVIIALGNLKSHLQKINTDLTKEQRSNIVRAVIMADTNAPMGVLKDVEAVLVDYGIARINIVGPEKYASPNQEIAENINLQITKKGKILDQNSVIIALGNLKSHLQKFNTKLTIEQRSNIVRAVIMADEDSPMGVLKDVEAVLVDYGVAQINIVGPEKYTSPNQEIQVHEGTTNSQIKEYNTLAKKYNAVPIEKRKIPLSDLKILESVYRKMNESQKEKAQPFPECLPKKVQDGATKKQIKEYNVLANKYNRQLSDEKSIQILKLDVERLEYLHGLMTHEQKENAEPFPDFPEPPPAPNEPKKPKAPKINKGEKSNIPPPPSPPDLNEVAVADKVIDEIIANQDPYDLNPMPRKVLKGEMGTIPPTSSVDELKTARELKEVKKKIQGVKYIKGEVDTELVEPPAPPEPKSPLDHVVEMAKKDATFYFEGKEISSDKAIDLLKKNKNLNIDSRGSKGKRPVVRISAQPIGIEN